MDVQLALHSNNVMFEAFTYVTHTLGYIREVIALGKLSGEDKNERMMELYLSHVKPELGTVRRKKKGWVSAHANAKQLNEACSNPASGAPSPLTWRGSLSGALSSPSPPPLASRHPTTAPAAKPEEEPTRASAEAPRAAHNTSGGPIGLAGFNGNLGGLNSLLSDAPPEGATSETSPWLASMLGESVSHHPSPPGSEQGSVSVSSNVTDVDVRLDKHKDMMCQLLVFDAWQDMLRSPVCANLEFNLGASENQAEVRIVSMCVCVCACLYLFIYLFTCKFTCIATWAPPRIRQR